MVLAASLTGSHEITTSNPALVPACMRSGVESRQLHQLDRLADDCDLRCHTITLSEAAYALPVACSEQLLYSIRDLRSTRPDLLHCLADKV